MFRPRFPRKVMFLLLILVVGVGLLGGAGPGAVLASETPVGPDRPVTVMTRNLYLGADLGPIFQAIAAGDPVQIGQAVFAVYQTGLASNFPLRATAVAAEIAATQPALVGLQEVVQWTGPLGDVDFLTALLAALADQGLHYQAIAVAPGFAYEFPLAPGVSIGLADRDVILARTDLPTSRLKLSGVQTGQYQARVILPLPDGSLVELPRAWAAVDVKIRGQSFRFINTHLESLSPPVLPVNIRALQALELLAGPAATDLPVLLVGDLNAEPGDAGDAAALILATGFVDSWAAVYPRQPGFTCCHPADLGSRDSLLSQRIDLVLSRGGFHTAAIDIVGEEPADFDVLGRWPSDHAGVAATLLIPNHPD